MVSKIFFSSNLVGRIFFPLLNALQNIFSLPISLQDFFPQKRVTCLHIQNVLTLTYSCFFFENRVNESFIFF